MQGERRSARRFAPNLLGTLFFWPLVSFAIEVTIPLPDGTALRAHWFPIDAREPRPTIVALHGCGGLYRRDGTTLDARYSEYVERFHRAGYHILLPDSFGSRGVGSLCTTPNARRSIKVETRRSDVAAAVQWAAGQSQVDTKRIALLGWSHGGSTTLAAINTARPGAAAPLAAAIVFYPGCKGFLRQPFIIAEPLLMLLGEQDDWTPPGPCLQLTEQMRARQPSANVTVRLYPDSVHGFDSPRPVRFWKDVPNGEDASGVHVGGNPAARSAALTEIEIFLKRHLGR